jgi:hypothetical protein
MSEVPRQRRPVFLFSIATVLGLWFGLTAPAISPVTPPSPAPGSQVAPGSPGA